MVLLVSNTEYRNRRACHNINVHVIILLQEKAVERTSQTKIKDEKN
jgi:hypothetical protein